MDDTDRVLIRKMLCKQIVELSPCGEPLWILGVAKERFPDPQFLFQRPRLLPVR